MHATMKELLIVLAAYFIYKELEYHIFEIQSIV